MAAGEQAIGEVIQQRILAQHEQPIVRARCTRGRIPRSSECPAAPRPRRAPLDRRPSTSHADARARDQFDRTLGEPRVARGAGALRQAVGAEHGQAERRPPRPRAQRHARRAQAARERPSRLRSAVASQASRIAAVTPTSGIRMLVLPRLMKPMLSSAARTSSGTMYSGSRRTRVGDRHGAKAPQDERRRSAATTGSSNTGTPSRSAPCRAAFRAVTGRAAPDDGERRTVEAVRVVDERIANERFDVARGPVAEDVRPRRAVDRCARLEPIACFARLPFGLGHRRPSHVDARVGLTAPRSTMRRAASTDPGTGAGGRSWCARRRARRRRAPRGSIPRCRRSARGTARNGTTNTAAAAPAPATARNASRIDRRCTSASVSRTNAPR